VRLFSYKISRDYGFAPNPFYNVCTLATCKPQIRANASVGDLIVGCGCKSNHLSERIICIMRVTGRCGFQEYWDNSAYHQKRPFFFGSRARAYGDNIYHRAAGEWVQEKSHHSYADGDTNYANLVVDTSTDGVLLSTDFVYWGRSAITIPRKFRQFNGDDLYPQGRNYRSRFADNFVVAVDDWFRGLPERGRIDSPFAWSGVEA